MKHSESWKTYFILFAVFYAFLYLCYFNWSGVVFEREIRLFGTDPYYHVRRIWLTALHYPRLLEFDYYVNYPTGAYIAWPPGFDFFLASIARFFAGNEPTLYEAGKISVIVSPLLGLLTIALIAIAGSRWFGKETGLLAALFTALNPAFLHTSRVGRVDHHMLEPFLLVLILYLFERAYSLRKASTAFLCGLAIAMSFLFVPVANVFPVIVFGFVLLKGCIDLFRRHYDETLARASRKTFLWAWVLAFPLSMTSHFARIGSFEVSPLSLFQPTLTLCLSAGIYIFWMIASLIVKRGISVRFFIYLIAGVILLAVPVLWLTPLKNAWMFLFKSDPIASTVIETQSILSYGLKDYIHDSSYLFLFTPLLLLWSIYRAKKERDFVSIITAYWLVTATVLAFTQIRLIPLLVPVFSLSLSNLLERGTKHLFKRRHPLLQKLKPVVLVIAFGVIIGLAYPSVDLFSKSERLYPSTSIRSLGEVFDSLLWIRDNTPKTDFLTEPWEKPQYGVMAPWSFGHYLNFFAERPNIANPFGWGKTHREGVFNSARFFVEDDEEKAVKLCRRLGVRFILTGEQNLLTYLHYLGIPKEDFLLQSGVDAGKVNKKYFSAMGSRLFYLNGSAANIEGFNVEALGHFRLVYESKHDSTLETTNRAKFSLVKIFEFVEGVKIHGRTTPNTEVSAKVPVLTNRNRRFEYHMRTQSNNEGYFEFYLPYSTEGNPYETGAQAPYRIQSNGKTIEITITEEEVINGAIKEVNFI